MSGRFRYQQLVRSRGEIRLLELLPNNHHLSKFRPACRLIHTSLDESPRFLALSYVWGDHNDTRIILVDKRPLRITRNLFDAMMGIREVESTTVWIDAICINQMDDYEKGWQVSLMGDIYRQAFKVLAWLGVAADNSDKVMDYLKILGGMAEACGLHHYPVPYERIWHAMSTTPSYMDDPSAIVFEIELDGRLLPVSKYSLQCLWQFINGRRSQKQTIPPSDVSRLFRRAWWGRVWVFQEITLPKRAEFACGSKRISHRRLLAAFNAFHALSFTLLRKQKQRLRQQQSLTTYEEDLISATSHRTSIMLTQSSIYREGRFPLVALLRATTVGPIYHFGQDGYQHLESTDPRDKVFALLGIACDQDELSDFGVFPDYTKSKEETYKATTTALLRQGHTSILSFCRASKRSDNWPSWAMDWSVARRDTLQDVEPDHVTLYPRFNASGPNRWNQIIIPKRDCHLHEILIMASIFDRILQVGDVPRMPKSETCVSSAHWLYEILRLSYDAADIYEDFNERLQAVVRTSHASIGWGKDIHLKRTNLFAESLSIFKDGLRSVTRQDIKQHVRGFLASKAAKNLLRSRRGDPYQLFHEFMRLSAKRSPFVTNKGHLGLGSHYAKQGDIIVIIGGAQVPFILRRQKSGSYKIISEAYVDGIMDGEAAEDGVWGHIQLV